MAEIVTDALGDYEGCFKKNVFQLTNETIILFFLLLAIITHRAGEEGCLFCLNEICIVMKIVVQCIAFASVRCFCHDEVLFFLIHRN